MSQNEKIRVGIIGAGNIAGHHITGYLQAAEHAQVTAIADVDAERARHHTERLDDPDIFLDYRDMVASLNVDAVDICLPHHLHKDAIVAAAAAGKHILCEKPLCLTLEEAAVSSHSSSTKRHSAGERDARPAVVASSSTLVTTRTTFCSISSTTRRSGSPQCSAGIG